MVPTACITPTRTCPLPKPLLYETTSAQELPAMGRFTLRDEGRTIAIGKVTKLPKNH